MSEENTRDPFAESFMKPHIEHGDYFEVETSNGTEIVPADVVRLPFAVVHAAGGYFHPDETGAAEFALVAKAMQPYTACGIERIEPKRGWLARMSAPGYMDCTDWTAHETEDEARAYLIEHYADDAS
jgi:hypothetical protein